MKRYKLKKEVKEILLFAIFVVAFLGLTIALIKDNYKGYEECINNGNSENFCHRLIEV